MIPSRLRIVVFLSCFCVISIDTANTEAQENPGEVRTPSDILPTCVRVSGAAQDASRLLLSPTKITIGLGPCSEVCEITVAQALEFVRKYPTAKELQLWGWPVTAAECQTLLRGIADIAHVHRVSLMGLTIDKPMLSIIADNPHVRGLALGGRSRISDSSGDGNWVFDAIAESSHLERLEISRHTDIPCSGLSRLKQMPRLKHFVFDGLIPARRIKSQSASDIGFIARTFGNSSRTCICHVHRTQSDSFC